MGGSGVGRIRPPRPGERGARLGVEGKRRLAGDKSYRWAGRVDELLDGAGAGRPKCPTLAEAACAAVGQRRGRWRPLTAGGDGGPSSRRPSTWSTARGEPRNRQAEGEAKTFEGPVASALRQLVAQDDSVSVDRYVEDTDQVHLRAVGFGAGTIADNTNT